MPWTNTERGLPMGVRNGLIFHEDRAVGDRCAIWISSRDDDRDLTFSAAARTYSEGLAVDAVAHIALMLPTLCVNGFNYGDAAPLCTSADTKEMLIQNPEATETPQLPVVDIGGVGTSSVGAALRAAILDPNGP